MPSATIAGEQRMSSIQFALRRKNESGAVDSATRAKFWASLWDFSSAD